MLLAANLIGFAAYGVVAFSPLLDAKPCGPTGSVTQYWK